MSEGEKADAIMGIFAGYKITFLDAPEVENPSRSGISIEAEPSNKRSVI